MKPVDRLPHSRVRLIGTLLLVVAHSVIVAGDGSAAHPTPSEIRDGYVGHVFSRLPDRTYSTWLVGPHDQASAFGISHVEDRGVEMLWLETARLPSTSKDNPLFSIVDVVVLPKDYTTDGLVFTMCMGGTRAPAVAALTEPETRTVHRAWAIDLATIKFNELSPAIGTCSPLLIREDE